MCLWTSVATAAHDGKDPPARSAIGPFTVSPLLGPGTPIGGAWSELSVTVEPASDETTRGRVEVRRRPIYGKSEPVVTATQPFEASPGAATELRVAIEGNAALSPIIVVAAVDDDGVTLDEKEVTLDTSTRPLLLDLSSTALLSATMTDLHVPYKSAHPTHDEERKLLIVPAQRDAITGVPVVPQRPAGYAATSAVLVDTKTLATLSEQDREALALWVLAGGTLGVTVSRSDDAQDPLLQKLAGGVPTVTALRPELGELRAVMRSSGAALGAAGELVGDDTYWIKRSPEWTTRESLTQWGGGNLTPSDLGASAPYGLGVVHVLPFDASRAPHDPWIHARLLVMVARAIERRQMLLFPHAQRADSTDARVWRAATVGRDADPRWMLLTAGALLALYALAAGPLLRRLTTGRGRERLRPALVPAASVAAAGALLLISCVGDRRSARTTRVEVIEAAAGMPRATTTSLTARTGRTRQRGAISAACPACLISGLTGSGPESDEVRSARGPTLELVPAPGASLKSRFVREEGFVELGEGVTVAGEAELAIVNRTGHALREVIARGIDQPRLWYFPLIAAGARVSSRDAEPVILGASGDEEPVAAQGPWAKSIADALKPRDGQRFLEAWKSFDDVTPPDANVWPAGVVVVLAVVDEGSSEGAPRSAFLRVLGTGGDT
jgi:hypothetical protein